MVLRKYWGSLALGGSLGKDLGDIGGLLGAIVVPVGQIKNQILK